MNLMDVHTFEQDLKNAMRAQDDVRRRTLRMVLAAVKLAQVEKQAPVDEAGLLSILQKEIKLRREAIADAEKAHRPDLIEASQAEIAVVESYLPKQLTQAELAAMAQKVIAEVGASGPADMGKVMKAMVAEVHGRAPGDQVSLVVRQLLQKA